MMSEQVLARCEVCGKPLESAYCTTNVCRDCCISGKCPQELMCASKAYERKKKGRNVDKDSILRSGMEASEGL